MPSGKVEGTGVDVLWPELVAVAVAPAPIASVRAPRAATAATVHRLPACAIDFMDLLRFVVRRVAGDGRQPRR